ncbi:hypothetical protein [Lacticaseibacillus suihuaensis]
MKYATQPILSDWQHNADAMAQLTQHAPSKTAKKTTITAILSSTNASRLLRCKVQRVGKQKLATPPRQAISLTAALAEAMGDNVVSLPEMLAAYYPNVQQREDYRSALKLGLTNMATIDFLTDRHHKKTPASQRKLFQVFSQDDIYRQDKRILADVARAVSLALFNQVSGSQLTVEPGCGLYLTRDTVRACMQRPAEASDEVLANALIQLRVAGFLRLAQDDELTEKGRVLSVSHDSATGKPVETHHIYVVSDFNDADWSLVQRNFKLNLNTRIGKTVISQLLGEDAARDYFPDLHSGVTAPVIGFMLAQASNAVDNTPIMTLAAAQDTTEAIANVSKATATKYVDQCLALRAVQAMKLSAREARALGYDLGEWQVGSPAEKLVVSTNSDVLLQCLKTLAVKAGNKDKISQLLDD